LFFFLNLGFKKSYLDLSIDKKKNQKL
jgi:hypothetical protein